MLSFFHKVGFGVKVCKFNIFSLTLIISHYTLIKTMFMYFCVWFSWL